MQINLHSNKLKKVILYLGWILFIICLWFKGCSPQPTLVTTPSITKTLLPDTQVVNTTIEIPKWYKDRTNEKKLSKDIDEMYSVIQKYQQDIDSIQTEFMWSDSIKKAELYKLATELKKFNSNFEDEHLKLSLNGIIAGNEVKEITPTYTIKQQHIQIPQKQVTFRLLGGLSVANTPTLNKPLFNANLGFQNAKGNILKVGYDSEKRFVVGYDTSIFKITK